MVVAVTRATGTRPGSRPRALRRPATRLAWSVAACLLAASASGGAALADDSWESWPELSAFVRLNPQTRLYFDAAYAKGKESPSRVVDLAAYVDISVVPILRPVLRQEDWARNRYLWARIGYDHVFEAEGGIRTPSEDRGILSIYAKAALPGEVWLEGRGRADLRWIGDDYSTRYRLRAEATREFILLAHPITPYFNVEWFYDTRYQGWSRILYQAGPEVSVNRRFRFEVYLARQENELPVESALNALGAVAKWYF
jgi:hypothetical protein